METLLDKIHDYYCSIHPELPKEELIAHMDGATVTIAIEIAEYAHRNQKQLNGKEYVLHAYDCLHYYREFVGITEDDYFCIDVDLMEECGVPFDGVQEVCMLHDVLEDTDVTMEEIEKIYNDLGAGSAFRADIKEPLRLITHDKSKDYPTYMAEVVKHPVSAMAKLMDLTSNMNLLRLNRYDEEAEERFVKYFGCFRMIEKIYQFIERVDRYNRAFAEQNGKLHGSGRDEKTRGLL